ncbi:hypothetical protein [Paraburkholderia caballeronis]|uniref:hypothetical protein n=1 Tax=Paraburkholderia caballeronis TaxID=416943 RepID=UPI001431D13F|nr:hypothetical protein [Paraburkholderia caballeronis]
MKASQGRKFAAGPIDIRRWHHRLVGNLHYLDAMARCTAMPPTLPDNRGLSNETIR